MKKNLLLFLVFLKIFNAYTQEKLPDFGKPTLEELVMKECEFDKDAPAMKLIDYRETELVVDYRIRIHTERRIRIKIFNEKGYNYASIKIPYNGRKKASKITDISAYIYNLDSSNNIVVQKIEKKQIFNDKSGEGVSTVAFTFPNLKPGSVIEYRYKKTDKNSVHFEPWFFQDKIPVLHSICKIIKPSVVQLDSRFVTVDSVKKEYSYNSNYPRYTLQTYIYSLDRLPSFRMEPLMSSVNDNLQRVEFALLPSFGFLDIAFMGKNKWDFFNLMLSRAEFFGGQIDKNITGTESIIDSAKLLTATSAKTNFIFEKVKSKISWDKSQTFYADDDLADVWKEGIGNSAEINLILLNLLRKVNIKCFPIIISTRDNGKPNKDFVSLSQFDGVDVLVSDSNNVYVLDGSNKYQSYLSPPLNILNREAFIIDPEKSMWVLVGDQRPLLKNIISGIGFIDQNGDMRGDANSYYYDLLKTEILSEKEQKTKDKDKDAKEFLEKNPNDVKIDSLQEANADDPMKPLTSTFKFDYKLSNSGDFYFLDPFFLGEFRKNPFIDSIRRTEIDFGANQYYSTSLYIDVPENMTIEELPKNKLLRTPDSTMLFTRIISRYENTIQFKTTFEFSRTIFYPDEYEMVRDFFKKMYGLISEQILLKKKN